MTKIVPTRSQAKDRSKLDSHLWSGSFNGIESTIQQLAPYVGKLKTGMARALITQFSEPGDIVCDPFCGSGVIPFESISLGREAWANDLNPYAYVLTRGKLEAPQSQEIALKRVERLLHLVEGTKKEADLRTVPKWVRSFYHKETLREILAAFKILLSHQDYFLLSCLLGILHHQRPGFLSYPASHLVPYLRNKKFPQIDYPNMYVYRDLRSRLLAKVKRAYRLPSLPDEWEEQRYQVWNTNSTSIPIGNETVDTIITSPPYFNALSYARDNRLRLWFLGESNWRGLDTKLSPKSYTYISLMKECLVEMHRVLKLGNYCILVLGDVSMNGTTMNTANILSELAAKSTNGGFIVDSIYSDIIPDKRRSRRHTKTTLIERILILKKVVNT